MAPRSKSRSHKGRAASIPIRVTRDPNDICSQCGMCCDGSLFSYGPLQATDVDAAQALGLEVVESADGTIGFAQPCPRFAGGCCSAYADRPPVCHEYRCGVLDEYEHGRLDLDGCLDVVENMRSLIRWLEDTTGMAPGTFSSATMKQWADDVALKDHPDDHEAVLAATDQFKALKAAYFAATPADGAAAMSVR